MLPLLPALALLAAFLLALQVVEGEQTSGIDGMLFGSGQEGQDTSVSNDSKSTISTEQAVRDGKAGSENVSQGSQSRGQLD